VEQEITIIPIAIDTKEIRSIARQPEANHILHIGTMYWPPNVDGVLWFVQEVYPLIRQQRPDVQLDVVGARPPREIVALDDSDASVSVAGYVTDPTSHLQRAALMVVPLRAGGGMRVKILNAWAQGIPIVSTTLGCEGIAATPGQNILLGDIPEEFATAVLNLLNDRDLANQVADRGRQTVVEKYDYRMACRPLHDVYARAMARTV
jgi:glycosyltransferase involved in cell wall biosynthesis